MFCNINPPYMAVNTEEIKGKQGQRSGVLQKDAEHTIQTTSEQWGGFKKSENENNSLA